VGFFVYTNNDLISSKLLPDSTFNFIFVYIERLPMLLIKSQTILGLVVLSCLYGLSQQAQTVSSQNEVDYYNKTTFSSYCASSLQTISTPGFESAITNVTLNTIDIDSDQTLPVTGGYEDYTGLTPIPDLLQGSTESISVTVNNGGTLDAHVWVFIDWNQDGDFQDINEDIDLGERNTIGDLPDPANSVNINVPVSATTGNTRMRVVLMSDNDNDIQPPCNDPLINPNFAMRFGEVEDYSINVTAPVVSYCASSLQTISTPGFESAITNVTFNTIDNDSDQTLPVTGGYEDYTGLTPIPDLLQGATEPISMTVNNGGTLDAHVWVFIDWNQDGDFQDINEDIDLGEKNTIGDLPDPANSVNINVPVSAPTGNTRMRVVLMSDNDNDIQPPCNDPLINPNFAMRFGEVEDYTINVIAGPEPELFISEIADPSIESNAKFVEVYNSSVDTIDLNNYYFAVEYNAGNSFEFFELTELLPPKSYYIIDSNENLAFENNYSISPNIEVSTPFGNGNDTYILSGYVDIAIPTDQDIVDAMFDIYGLLGQDGFGENWEYDNSRAYRKNPEVKNANTTWTVSEWTVAPGPANTADMTPGYGDNDYIYDGSWTNIGLGDPAGMSTTNENIFIRSGNVTLSGDIEIGDLVVRSAATLTLASDVKLTVTGDILNEGTIVFESNATSTAVLETVPSNTRVVGNGFEIRRYIPVVQTPNPIRAFRYLSSSVDTENSIKPTINDNWQEGLFNPDISTNNLGTPGLGTHITGSSVPNNTLGFDVTETGNASMYFWDNNPTLGDPTVQIGWTAIPSTNNTNDTFSVGDAYAILIRGDRNSPLNSNTATGDPTTLRTTGQIHVGDFEVQNLSTTIGHFNLVGNPYQSQVDLSDLLSNTNSNSQGLDEQFIYIWDPTIGILGGYATVDLSDGSSDISPVPGSSDANEFLQPQQAFFIETKGGSPSLTFTEDTKDNSDPQTAVFSTDTETATPTQLDISLKAAEGKTYDGLRIVYDNAYTTAIDQYDATKFWNYTDNLSVLSNGNYLSIEKRSIPSNTDVTPLYFGAQSLENYSFDIILSTEGTFNAFLVDHYTNQSIAIPANAVFNYDFSVDPNLPESLANDRFEIAYDSPTLGVEGLNQNQFSIYPNPLGSNQMLYIQSGVHTPTPIKKIEILNLNAQILEVYEASELDSSSHLHQIQLKRAYNSGTYLLKIQTEQTTSMHKIIVH